MTILLCMKTSLDLENSSQYVETNPFVNFLFTLNAPETKRLYPKRLEVFLDFLNLTEVLKKRF